ncbi:MAG: hypothetical protein JXR76_29725 [Deltaproteobacteria bacterium]|nr:hypothetical protein [Deltaproteobacteria bacterium]
MKNLTAFIMMMCGFGAIGCDIADDVADEFFDSVTGSENGTSGTSDTGSASEIDSDTGSSTDDLDTGSSTEENIPLLACEDVPACDVDSSGRIFTCPEGSGDTKSCVTIPECVDSPVKCVTIAEACEIHNCIGADCYTLDTDPPVITCMMH